MVLLFSHGGPGRVATLESRNDIHGGLSVRFDGLYRVDCQRGAEMSKITIKNRSEAMLRVYNGSDYKDIMPGCNKDVTHGRDMEIIGHSPDDSPGMILTNSTDRTLVVRDTETGGHRLKPTKRFCCRPEVEIVNIEPPVEPHLRFTNRLDHVITLFDYAAQLCYQVKPGEHHFFKDMIELVKDYPRRRHPPDDGFLSDRERSLQSFDLLRSIDTTLQKILDVDTAARVSVAKSGMDTERQLKCLRDRIRELEERDKLNDMAEKSFGELLSDSSVSVAKLEGSPVKTDVSWGNTVETRLSDMKHRLNKLEDKDNG